MKRFIFAFLLSLVMVVSYSIPSYATSTVDLAITGEGAQTESTYVGGAADYTNLNSNDDVTYLYNNVAGYMYHCYNMANFVASAASINSVVMTYRIACTTYGTQFTPYIRDLSTGTNYYGTTSIGSFSWSNITNTWALNPVTGGAWTAATINAYEWGFRTWGDSGIGQGVYTSYMKLTVSYEPMVAPTVTTQAVSAITPTTATGNGNVTSDGGSVITERGTVYNTTTNPDTATGTKDTAAGTTGAYTTSIDTLTKGTLYHVRAYAINAIGTSYGADVSFTTIADPTISTSAASLVSSTTARLNSNVTFDGGVVTGEPCTIRFVYIAGTGYADYAAIVAGAETTVDVAGTWTTGQLPYADITGLAVSTTYSFAVRIVNSTATYGYGAVTTFTTESGVYTPTNFTAIPTATTVSLAWAKGVGAQYTLVRYSASTYPLTTADGIVAYLDTGNSKTLTGLTPGTTYYFSAWGKTAAVYSASSITVMATTLAYDTAVSTGTIEAPPSNSWWNQTPSTTKVGTIPLVSALISTNATVYAIPEASLWYFLWVLFSVGLGVIIYVKSGMNLVAGLGSQALLFALGAVLGLTMLWIMVIFMVIGVGFTLWGNRH